MPARARVPAPPQRVVAGEARALEHLPGPAHAVRDRDLVAVLQVAADAGQVDAHGDAVRAQLRGRADARQHQQLRRVEGAAAQDHLAPRAHLARARPARSLGCGMRAVEARALAGTRRRWRRRRRRRARAWPAHRARCAADRGCAARDLEQALARAGAAMAARRQRRVAEALEAAAAASGRAFGSPAAAQPAQRARQRRRQAADEGARRCRAASAPAPSSPSAVERDRLLGAQPAVPAVAGRVDAEPAQRAPDRPWRQSSTRRA